MSAYRSYVAWLLFMVLSSPAAMVHAQPTFFLGGDWSARQVPPVPVESREIPSASEISSTSDSVASWFERSRRNGMFGSTSTKLLLIQQSDADWKALNSAANEGADDGPDVGEPGPDMGDFPNSAFTLKKGRVQLEMAPVSFRTKNTNNPSAYAWPYLFRYGVTDNVEFRVFGTGLTSLINPGPTTGFGAVVLDTKIHLWDARMEYLLPAVAFEASLQTQLASAPFQAGTEPSLNINMDFPFTKKTNFEATVSYSGSLANLNLIETTPIVRTVPLPLNVYFFTFQWAVEHELTSRFSVFTHGYYSIPVRVPGDAGIVVGSGFFYKVTQRTMLFGSANAGLTHVPAPFLTQLGVAYAF